MPFTGICYRVIPGNEDRIAEIFSPENFTRVDSPVLRDLAGEEIGYLVATGLFVHADRVLRVIQYVGGTVDDVCRHMSVQEGVREAERRLEPFLPEARDTQTAAGFVAHFRRSLMRVTALSGPDDVPIAGLVALPDVGTGASPNARTPDGAVPDGAVATFRLESGLLSLRIVQTARPAAPETADLLAELYGTGAPLRCISHLSAAVVD